MKTISCLWTLDRDYNSDSWDTECGSKFEFTCDGPKENSFQFCPYCGGDLDFNVDTPLDKQVTE